MINICYYVSDYGYGHAARSIAIIRSLIEYTNNRIRIIVCSNKALSFLKVSLGQNAVEYRETYSDLGYVLKHGSIEPDIDELERNFKSYLKSFPEIITREMNFLLERRVNLVISDISPVPFIAAELANIKSVGISNFTWYTAYKQMLDEDLLEPLYNAYSYMDYFISLPGANEPEWGHHGRILTDFFCRTPDFQHVNRLKNQLNPDKSKKIVFFAIGMSIHVNDLKEMPLWEDNSCLYIISNNMKVSRENIVRLPKGYTESQDYIALSDLVITKPGWSTVSEAVCLKKPLLLLERNSFLEDRNTVEALPDLYPHRLIKWEDLKGTKEMKVLVESLSLDESVSLFEKNNKQLQNIVTYLTMLVGP